MIDMSRMPTSDMFSVRGIGVAVIVSTSTRLRICLMRLLVRDAEALLLVDDQQAEILEHHVLRQQAMGADDDVDLAGGEPREDRPSISCLVRKRLTMSMVTGKPAKRSRSVFRC